MKPVLWDNLTEKEISALVNEGMDSILLPVGATEQHGPHLACGTDSIISFELASAVSANTGVPVLPNVNYGCSIGHSHAWHGTIALDPKLMIDMIASIGRWTYHNGFRRIFILNGHVTNHAPLRCALEVLRSEFDDVQVALMDTARITDEIATKFSSDAADWHANRAETSVIRYLKPECVHLDLLQEADDEDRTTACVFSHPVNRTSKNGVTGFPSQSSVEEGQALWTKMVSELTQIIQLGMKESPPLEQSYFYKLKGRN